MDKNLLLQLLFNLATLLIGGSVIFYKSKKRKASADADRSEADADRAEADAESIAIQNMQEAIQEWKAAAKDRQEIIARKDLIIESKDAQISKLYLEKGTERQDLHRKDQEIATLKIELQAANFKECRVRGCTNRNPPNELF